MAATCSSTSRGHQRGDGCYLHTTENWVSGKENKGVFCVQICTALRDKRSETLSVTTKLLFVYERKKKTTFADALQAETVRKDAQGIRNSGCLRGVEVAGREERLTFH